MRFVRLLSRLASFVVIASLAAQNQTDPKKDPDQIGSRDVSKGVNWYSIPKELALGKQLATQVARNSTLINDPVITEYVNRLAQNLARNSDTKFPITTQVIEDDSINALSLPGGFFFVNTGLVLAAANESELAGAMAHEIAHIAARHGTRTATRGQIAQLSTIPLIFIGGWPGVGASQAANAVVPIGLLQFSKAFESEADLLGLEYLYKSGYDPLGMVNIFEKIEALQQKQPGRVAKIFMDHPATGDRIVKVQQDIQELLKAQPQYVVNTSEFDRVKARLQALENRRKNQPASPNKPTLRRRLDAGELVAEMVSSPERRIE